MEPEEQPPEQDWVESYILVNATSPEAATDFDGSDT
jgi:hypothetical protein